MSDSLASAPSAEAPASASTVDESRPSETEPAVHEADIDSADDTEEVDHEHDGRTYRVPKALKSALMMHADYTRKTQELATHRKGLEERDKQFREHVARHHANFREAARLVALDEQLQHWSRVNWQQLNAEDPQHAQSLWFQYNQLKDTHNTLAGQVVQKQRHAAVRQQYEAAMRAKGNRATLAKLIPEWSPDLDAKLTNFAVGHGLTREQLAGAALSNPQAVKILHLAYLGHHLVDRQRQAAEPALPEAKPVPQLSTRAAPAARNPERMNTEEWMRFRNAQVAKRGRR